MAAKRVAPRTSLGALTFAAEFLDELWLILLLLGVEQVKVVPGLMASCSICQCTDRIFRCGRAGAVGIGVYLRATRARDRLGSWGLWVYIAVLALIYLSSNASPPPPSERVLAWTALAIWLFVPWAWWVDRHRMPVTVVPA